MGLQEQAEELKSGQPTPAAEGGSANGGSSSSDVKGDVKPQGKEEIPTHDEKGVPYYNRYREMEGKYKDIDLERYAALKDIDLDNYNELRAFAEALEEDEELYNEVMGVVQGRKKSGQPEGEKPEAKPGDPRYDKLEKTVTSLQSRIEAEDNQKALNEYEKSFETSAKGLDLDEEEKTRLNRAVEDRFIQDYQSGKPKLTLKDVDKIVKEEYKSLDDYRRKVVTSWSKKNQDGSPPSLKGGSPNVPGKEPYDPLKATKNERVNAIADELKEKLS